MQLVDRNVRLIKRLTDRTPKREWVLEYSPEAFSMTELEVALEACHTAMARVGGGPCAAGHHQPAHYGRERYAKHVCGPDRMDAHAAQLA